jgi:hypothetical protein
MQRKCLCTEAYEHSLRPKGTFILLMYNKHLFKLYPLLEDATSGLDTFSLIGTTEGIISA